MRTSIIIPTYNNLELTKKCLAALRLNTVMDGVEIIVVDNASTDETPDFLKTQDFLLSIMNQENHNFAGACNQGERAAKGETLVFLNNDTEVHPGWLEAIESTLVTHDNIGAVGVKLLFPDGTVQHAGVVISEDRLPRHIYYRSNSRFPGANKTREFKAVTAACIAVPRSVFNAMGGFDEEFINGLEDVDLCLRLHHAGYRILYVPDSVVTHHESVAPGRFTHNDHNIDLYMSRWNREASDEHSYYRNDGFSRYWILKHDLRLCYWGDDKYGTRPLWIIIARLVFIPAHKIVTLFKLLFQGDYSGILQKIRSHIKP